MFWGIIVILALVVYLSVGSLTEEWRFKRRSAAIDRVTEDARRTWRGLHPFHPEWEMDKEYLDRALKRHGFK